MQFRTSQGHTAFRQARTLPGVPLALGPSQWPQHAEDSFNILMSQFFTDELQWATYSHLQPLWPTSLSCQTPLMLSSSIWHLSCMSPTLRSLSFTFLYIQTSGQALQLQLTLEQHKNWTLTPMQSKIPKPVTFHSIVNPCICKLNHSLMENSILNLHLGIHHWKSAVGDAKLLFQIHSWLNPQMQNL